MSRYDRKLSIKTKMMCNNINKEYMFEKEATGKE